MNIVKQGNLKGVFKGFSNQHTVFEFADGRRWRQAEYRYHFHFAYSPEALILEGGGAYYIKVSGIDAAVRVVRLS